jgi:hypothetical protein
MALTGATHGENLSCIGALQIPWAVEARCAAQGLDEVFKCANTQVGVAATQVGVCSMCAPDPRGCWCMVLGSVPVRTDVVAFHLVCRGGDMVLHDTREWSHGRPCLAGGPGENISWGMALCEWGSGAFR